MRRLILFTILVLLAAGAGLVAAQPGEKAPARAAAKPAIAVTGKVDGLYPGASKRIRLKLEQPLAAHPRHQVGQGPRDVSGRRLLGAVVAGQAEAGADPGARP